MEKEKKDIGAIIDEKRVKLYTQLLTDALATAEGKFEQPWMRRITDFSPQGFDGNKYAGSNQFWLGLLNMVTSAATPIHVTLNRAGAEGFHVKKGEIGQTVVHYNPYYSPTVEGKKMGLKMVSTDRFRELAPEIQEYYTFKRTLSYSTVFNLDQTDIAKVNPELYKSLLDRFSRIDGTRDEQALSVSLPALDRMIAENAWVCPIHTDSVGQAYWTPKQNFIRVPEQGDFRSNESFYRTLIHEMIHSTSILPKYTLTPAEEKMLEEGTGSPERLEKLREMKNTPMRTFDYKQLHERAREEMVAELGSAMVTTMTGMDAQFAPENKQYLSHWYARLGFRSEMGMVENPAVTSLKKTLVEFGFAVNADKLVKDIAALGKGMPMECVLKDYQIPHGHPVLSQLEMIRDGWTPLEIMGTKLVPLTEEEKKNLGVGENVLLDIVNDAWTAAKVVIRDGMKLDLAQVHQKGVDVSVENTTKRPENVRKTWGKGAGSKAGYRKTTSSTRKASETASASKSRMKR